MPSSLAGWARPPVHIFVWLVCRWCTLVFQLCLGLAGLVFGRTQSPPPCRLRPPSQEKIGDLLEELPRVTLPKRMTEGTTTLAFAPCSNLCIYVFGVAACLRRATNFAEVEPHLRYHGVSSGALVAVSMAMGKDLQALFEECVGLLGILNVRRGGWIGAYSRTIRQIVHSSASGKSNEEIHEATAEGRVSLGVTVLDPLPTQHQITNCASSKELEDAVLASCYIPVVWEQTIWLKDLGLCIDGGASGFLLDGDVVISPYHSNVPDVGPIDEYPRQLVFQPVDARDMVRLFEDGYQDCVRWVEGGCRSQRSVRQAKLQISSSVGALLREGMDTFLEVAGIRNKVPGSRR